VIKIPKVILEFEDIQKLIKEAYDSCEIVSGLDKDIEIIIKVDNFEPKRLPPIPIPQPGKTIQVPQTQPGKTVPGGAMGNQRGSLPVF
jgi:hypothetical protein